MTEKPSGVLELVSSKSKFHGILPVWGRTAMENTNPDMQKRGVVVVRARRVGGRNCDVGRVREREEPAAVSAQ